MAIGQPPLRIIATEEAFATSEWMNDMDCFPPTGPEAVEANFLKVIQNVPAWRNGLLDLDIRLREMDENGVDIHLLSLTTPGVQTFEGDHATALARQANDWLASTIRERPTRFAGLACVAPQDPQAAANEIRRAIGVLGLNGVIINSYTNDEFLDLPKFDPILAACTEMKAPLYLHPRTPAPSMIKPFAAHGLVGALWGFQADTSLHAMRLIMSGAFDRHPDLTLVLGHMGEGIPYWFWRIDNMSRKYPAIGAMKSLNFTELRQPPSEYFKTNIYITTSGMNWHRSLQFGIDTVGADRIMFAIDFPYESSAESVEFLRTASISESDRALIAHANAERVFSIR